MNFINRYLKIVVLLILFVISVLPFIINKKGSYTIRKITTEKFDEKLLKHNTIDKSIIYIDSCYFKKEYKETIDTQAYVNTINEFIKNRFHHGLSNYDVNDNWIAYLASKTFWSHFSAIVIPNDILKYPEALCSQQNIVFVELLENKGIKYRTVGLGTEMGPGHFLIEVFYNNNWHLYDVDVEPNWAFINNNHKSLSELQQNKNELYQIYDGKIQRTNLDKLIENISYGAINQSPAKKMKYFHYITYSITIIIPFLIGFLLVRIIQRQRAKKSLLNDN